MRQLIRLSLAAVIGSAFIYSSPALAESDDADDHEAAVMHVLDNYDIPIKYDYIATLMRLPNAFGEGAACVVCHTSNNPKKSPAGLDLTTCEGIHKGSDNGKMITPGKHKGGLFRRRMRDNRMPLGVRFDVSTELPAIMNVRKWIEDGAKNDTLFKQKVLPSFKSETAFGGEQACTECHMSNQEPPSFH